MKFLLPILAMLIALPASAGWNLDQLMQDLARNKGGKARFVEKKYIAVLDRPVQSSGELTYAAPDRLEKRTLQPKAELMVLDRDVLSIERGKQKFTLRLAEQPEALAFVDSIRGTLAGDRKALERSYSLYVAGNEEKWTLSLLPSDSRIAALVTRITIAGSRGRVSNVEYLQADGDRAVMTIEVVEPR